MSQQHHGVDLADQAGSSKRRSTRRLVVVQVADNLYGLPLEEVEQITFMAELLRPAGLPRILNGFLNLEGTLIPVLRLARVLGVQETEPELYTPLLILRSKPRRLALEVSRVVRVMPIRDDLIMPFDSAISVNGCVTGVVQDEATCIAVIAIRKLLLEQEQQRIAAITSVEQERLCELEGAAL
jgi:purine-binding chemotaxis protein CheW